MKMKSPAAKSSGIAWPFFIPLPKQNAPLHIPQYGIVRNVKRLRRAVAHVACREPAPHPARMVIHAHRPILPRDKNSIIPASCNKRERKRGSGAVPGRSHGGNPAGYLLAGELCLRIPLNRGDVLLALEKK